MNFKKTSLKIILIYLKPLWGQQRFENHSVVVLIWYFVQECKTSSLGSRFFVVVFVRSICSHHIPCSAHKNLGIRANSEERVSKKKMVKVGTYFAMTLGAFVFWQSMDKVHVWIALHQDEKVSLSLYFCRCMYKSV